MKTTPSIVKVANRTLPEQFALQISLINGPRQCVISRAPRLLLELRTTLGDRRIAPGEAQNRTPFTERMFDYHTRFLPMTVPFHHRMLTSAVSATLADCAAHGFALASSKLQQPLISTFDGSNLQSVIGDLIPELARLIATERVNWTAVQEAMLKPEIAATHALDFGPGSPSAAAVLTAGNASGHCAHTTRTS